MNFLRLLEKVTNGSTIEIGHTGTTLSFEPGIIKGGIVEHECNTSRSIGYYLEPLICIAPFSKLIFKLTLTGVTNDTQDVSVDILRTVNVKLLKLFNIDEGVELKIKKRGAPPLGGGEVYFTCPIVNSVPAIQLTEEGRIKRIRGIAVATRVSPQIANRLVERARSVLNRFIPDINIYTDVYKGSDSGKSPGFSLSLVAESATGALLSADAAALPQQTAEEVGITASKLLLNEIKLGGFVDTCHQWMIFLFMALGPEDVSKVSIGKMTQFSQQFLTDLERVFGVVFKQRKSNSGTSLILTCVGSGYQNYSRRVQ